MEEIHLFIIWSKGRYAQEQVLSQAAEKFEIVQKYEVEWSKENFSQNLTRFYGENLPKNSGKETHCGTDPFLAFIIKDKAPRYEVRDTGRGFELVNINIFDAKAEWRDLTGGGHKIHGTNDPAEAAHDIVLLLGQNIDDLLASNDFSEEIKPVKSDLPGTGGWKDLGELFYVLNSACPYVVLRNFESFPDQYVLENHGDIDFLTFNVNLFASVTNAKKNGDEPWRVFHEIEIGEEKVPVDIRFIGDDYYDPAFSHKILNSRHLDIKGFYRPDDEHYFYSLMYHALVHREDFPTDYLERLETLPESQNVKDQFPDLSWNWDALSAVLKLYLLQHSYGLPEPKDCTVQFNHKGVGLRAPKVSRKKWIKWYWRLRYMIGYRDGWTSKILRERMKARVRRLLFVSLRKRLGLKPKDPT